ncbi:MAG: hypothetical protein HZB70_03105 [Candidatus Berkelbacteria bacterium]|nr:MAG: hypothetical protein HZB70_03105 [Candidatus Berkelbacteria bacterium]QQG51709.1 MAG: hypothetical protein HY845_04085 [Candidatus Berkelbacteria bacterium]
MNLDQVLNLIPPCLRGDNVINETALNTCVIGSVQYYINLLLIVIGIAAFFFLVYGGIQMATAFGNEAKYTAAKNTVSHAIMGIIIASLAYMIVSFVTSFFGADAPTLYNEKGQEVTNDSAKVAPLAVSAAYTKDPDPNTLSADEIAAVRGGSGSAGESLPIDGSGNISILLHDRAVFEAKLVSDSGTLDLDIKEYTAEGTTYYWVRSWGKATSYKNGKLVIKQKVDGVFHTREVKIEVPDTP